VPVSQQVEGSLEVARVKVVLEEQQLVLVVQLAKRADRCLCEAEGDKLLVGPRHERPAGSGPLPVVAALLPRVRCLLEHGDDSVGRVEVDSHALGPVLHGVSAIEQHDDGVAELLPDEPAIDCPTADVRREDRLPVGGLADGVRLEPWVVERLGAQFQQRLHQVCEMVVVASKRLHAIPERLGLHHIEHNSAFLPPPERNVPNLASRRRREAPDRQNSFGYRSQPWVSCWWVWSLAASSAW